MVMCVPHWDMRHIVSIEAWGASAWLPLGKRDYDPETDTLNIGVAGRDDVEVTENGDASGGCPDPFGCLSCSVDPYSRLRSF